MRFSRLALIVMFLTALCSCGETDRVTGTVVGPEGGTVTGLGGVLLQIPAGALDQEVEILIEKVSGAPGGFNPVGDVYEFGPAGTIFSVPVTVSLPYDESLVLGSEAAVRVWWSLSMDGAWAPLEGSADTARNTVSGQATHFSFGAPGEPEGGCQPDCQGRECGPDGCGDSCPPGCGENQTCDETAGTCECTHLECGGACCAQGQVCHQDSCCTPDCGTRECGPDPACGTDCGTCGENQTCSAAGACECTHLECGGACCAQGQVCHQDSCCTPDCGTRECGPDPVCGTDCGQCDPGDVCTPEGTCETPAVCDVGVTPADVNFGTVVSGQADSIDLVVTNRGGAVCTFTGAELTQNSPDSEFSIVGAPAPNTDFAPGQSLTVSLQYAPVNLGADAGALVVSAGDPDGDIPVDLSGEGVATAVCDLQVTPLTIAFGTVKPAHTSSATITLQNTGTDDCTVSDIELRTGVLLPGEFVLPDAQTPLVVDRAGQPNSTRLLEVVFAPTQADIHSATVWITSDDPDLQQSGNINCDFPTPPQPGQACVPVSGTCAESRIQVVPTELDFGVVAVGCSSAQAGLAVYNLDAADLNISDIYLGDPADPNFEIASTPALPHQLAGGASVEILMLYHPQDAVPHGGMLYIESDATNAALLSVPLQGQGTNVSDQTDVFVQPSNVKTDVLFVVDNSGSMGEEQSALASNFSSFIQYAVTLDVDYHIGVIATEVNDAETGLGTPARDIYPGVLVQAPGCPKIITPSTPDVGGCFADNVMLGTCCSDEQEAGLEAAWMALTPPEIDDPTQNAGFLRQDAKLYIICVSDEQDQSGGSADFYVDFFEHLKGPQNTEWIKLSAICGDCPDGCGAEQAECGSRYIEVANRTGGIFESICTSNWAQAMQNLGIDAFSTIREYPLSRPADPATIAVTVDSSPVPQASCPGCPDGWTHYSDDNSVYFGDDVVPASGAQIEITYTAACL